MRKRTILAWILILIYLLLAPGFVAFGQTQTLQQDSKTHKVIKPPASGSAAYDVDFTDVTTNLAGGGGGGSPGGLNKQFQFNSSATFGGVPYITYDGTSVTQTAGARYFMIDALDITKRVQFQLSVPTASTKVVSIFDNSVTVAPLAPSGNLFVTGLNTSGVVQTAQPAFSNLSGLLTLSQTSMATGKLLGRATAATGPFEEITLGTNLAYDIPTKTLNATGGGGTPGGSTTQFQFNSTGTFGGTSALTITSGIIHARASVFRIDEFSDPTKQINFDLTNVPTGTVNTLLIPAAAISVAVAPDAGATNNFLTGISPLGVVTKAQPAFSNLSGTITQAQNTLSIGKQLWVDSVNGNDGTGARGNLARPFLTINAALTASSAGDVVYVGPGTYAQSTTAVAIPAGVTLVGSGVDFTVITSAVTAASNRAAMELKSGSAIYDVTVQNTASSGAAFGALSASATYSGAYAGGCKFIGVSNGVVLSKSSSTGMVIEDSQIVSQGTAFNQTVSTTTDIRRAQISADATAGGNATGVSVSGGGTTVIFDATVAAINSTGSNIAITTTGSGSKAEAHMVRITQNGTGTTNLDLQQASSASLLVDNVTRDDAGVPTTSGVITSMSQNLVKGLNLSDVADVPTSRTNLGLAIGTNVQAWDTQLDSLASLTYASNVGKVITVNATANGFELDTPATGDASTNTSTSVDSEVALFSGTAGKTLKRATGSGIATVTSGVLGTTTNNSTNWDTAFTDRLKWDGGATGLTAATGRASLGATVAGANLFTITSPGAISWIQFAADNSASTKTASEMRTNLSLVPGTDVEAHDPDLTALAALTGTNTIYYRSAASTWSPVTIGSNMTFSSGTLNSTAATSIPSVTNFLKGDGAGGVSDSAKAVPTGAVVGTTDTQTLTTKRITKRSNSISAPANAPTINTDTYDVFHLTGIAGNLTNMSTNLSGTPVEGDMIRFDFTDNGSARTINWSTGYEASPGQSLPTTTTASTRLDVAFVWNSVTSKWRALATSDTTAGSGTVTSVGLAGTANQVTVTGATPITSSGTWTLSVPAAAQLDVAKLTNLTGNGFVKTSAGDGTLGTDTTTYVASGGALGTPSSGTLTNATGLPIAGLTASTSTALGVGSIELGHATDTTIARSGAGAITVEGTAVLLSGGALGTPSSATLTNATGLPVSGITASTSTALGVGSLELGHASDTTIARSGAGAVTVEGVQVLLSGAALGTPSSGTLTNATGLPIAGLTASTSTALGVGSIELGHASDTSIARDAAGRVTIEGVKVLEKTPIVGDSSAPSSPYTPDSDANQMITLRAIGAALTINAPSGTPVQGQHLTIRLKDDGTARALTFQTGSSGYYRFSSDMAAPSTTVLSKTMYLGFIYNSTDSRWDNVAQLNNF